MMIEISRRKQRFLSQLFVENLLVAYLCDDSLTKNPCVVLGYLASSLGCNKVVKYPVICV